MRLINEESCKELGMTPAEYIASNYDDLLNNDQALVTCINNEATNHKGYLLGIATRNERGYMPTLYILNEHNYDVANKWVEEANDIIFDRDKKETMKIILSSLRPL